MIVQQLLQGIEISELSVKITVQEVPMPVKVLISQFITFIRTKVNKKEKIIFRALITVDKMLILNILKVLWNIFQISRVVTGEKFISKHRLNQ